MEEIDDELLAAHAGTWTRYRLRDTFNLFELACLLHRFDPERVSDATQDAFERACEPEIWRAFSLAPGALAQRIAQVVEASERPGRLLADLRAALATPTVRLAVPRERAKALAANFHFKWPPELEAAAPAPHAPAPPAVVTRSTTDERRDALRPAIDEARRRCDGSRNVWQVWNAMLVLADEEFPPLVGVIDLQTIKHRGGTFTRNDLADRLQRAAGP